MRPTYGLLVLTAFAGVLATVPAARAQDGARGWRGRPAVSPSGAPVPVPAGPSGTGRLRNAARHLCLDVAGWGAQGNFDVLLWDCNEDPDQVWSFAPGGELRDVLTGQCLDVAGYSGNKGADVGTYRCEGLDDQRWRLTPRANGQFEIRNAKRGLCLDVQGRAGNRGDNVLVWACDGGPDQLWSWEPYAAPGPQRHRPVRHMYQPSDPPDISVPPPPPSGPPAMDEASFARLTAAVKKESFSENQVTIIETAARRNHFRVAQVKALLEPIAFSASKLRALEMVAPRLTDPQNNFELYDCFSFSADKDRARQILKRNGQS